MAGAPRVTTCRGVRRGEGHSHMMTVATGALIVDPLFYLAAIPAVILTGLA